MCYLVENFLWTCFPGLLSLCVTRVFLQELEARLMEWIGVMEDGEDLCDSLRVRSERKGRQQQVFCYRAEDGTGGGAWICKGRRRSVNLWSICGIHKRWELGR